MVDTPVPGPGRPRGGSHGHTFLFYGRPGRPKLAIAELLDAEQLCGDLVEDYAFVDTDH